MTIAEMVTCALDSGLRNEDEIMKWCMKFCRGSENPSIVMTEIKKRLKRLQ